MEEDWYTAGEEGFALRLPAGWQAEPDAEEGGVELARPDGFGVLHLYGFARPPDDLPDPGEELYAFLEEQEIEIEEDEVDDSELAGGGELAVCEYLTEGDEDDGSAYWLVAVASLPGTLVFAHYTCAAGDEEAERAEVYATLRSLRAPQAT